MRRFYENLIFAMAVLAGVILVGMSLWVTYDVLMRYVLASPTIWADDLSEYGLLWATFLAAPWVLRQEGHVRVGLVVERLAPRHQRLIGIGTSLVGALVCGIFAWQTAMTTADFFARGLIVARNWAIPLWVPYVIIPWGSAFLVIEFVARAARYARGSAAGQGAESVHL